MVVGGGISGLAAAYRLRRLLGASARITLIEQTDRLGGKLRTAELAGVAYDVGAEAFLNRRPEAVALVESARVLRPGGTLVLTTDNPLRLAANPQARAEHDLPGLGRVIEESRFAVWRSPTTDPWRYGPTAFACTENIIG